MRAYRCNVIRDTTGLRMSMKELEDTAAYIRSMRTFYGLSEKERWRRSPYNGKFDNGVELQQIYDALCHHYPLFLTPGASMQETRYALQGWHDAIWRGSRGLQRSHWHQLAATIDRLMYLLLLMEGKIR